MGKLQRRSNRMKKGMQQLNIANEMLTEGIYERDHGIVKGYTDLEIANVNKEDCKGSGDPEDRHITHTITCYINDIIHTCLTKPSKKGRRAKPINILKSNGEDAPMELHKTGEEPLAQQDINQ